MCDKDTYSNTVQFIYAYLLAVMYVCMYVDIQRWIPCDKDHLSVVCKQLTDLPSDKVSKNEYISTIVKILLHNFIGYQHVQPMAHIRYSNFSCAM